MFVLHVIAYNLIRLGNLLRPTAMNQFKQRFAQRCGQLHGQKPQKLPKRASYSPLN